jgi:hypothetical protein
VGADNTFAVDARLTITHIDRARAPHLLHLIASRS